MDASWLTLEHAESIGAILTSLGAIFISQRKLSIASAAESAKKLKDEAIETAEKLKKEMAEETRKYQIKWEDCEIRDKKSQVKIQRLEDKVDNMEERLSDCERRHYINKRHTDAQHSQKKDRKVLTPPKKIKATK